MNLSHRKRRIRSSYPAKTVGAQTSAGKPAASDSFGINFRRGRENIEGEPVISYREIPGRVSPAQGKGLATVSSYAAAKLIVCGNLIGIGEIGISVSVENAETCDGAA